MAIIDDDAYNEQHKNTARRLKEKPKEGSVPPEVMVVPSHRAISVTFILAKEGSVPA
ncbi:4842_t:CDS:2 [Acaulospora colombiana]|uniref:4842_t:CDS:1 n=1 Tax=Acaulospora colombiana TaxID=27376 RepID=A0ACA9K4A9_9GLOM|nr:4842_t:CDS:2 [Acaulospora colombiana]